MTSTEYLDQVKNFINEISKINFNNNDAYAHVIETFKKIEKIPIISYTLNKGEQIYRARINDEEYFKEIKKISAPNSEYVKEYGRANIPGQTIFYGSEDRPTSYMEFLKSLAENKNFGERVSFTIGEWKLNRDIKLALIRDSNDSRETRYNNLFNEALEAFTEKVPKEYIYGARLFFHYIAKEFSRSVKNNINTYMITSAYSNIILNEEKYDGIIYPSVPSDGSGFNVAIKKSSLSKNAIELEALVKDTFAIKEQNNGKFNFVEISSIKAKSINLTKGIIEW